MNIPKLKRAPQNYQFIEYKGEVEMREIKFRGKTEQGEWVKGYYVEIKDFGNKTIKHCVVESNSDFDLIEKHTCQNIIAVIPETVGQYTGFKDKNDTKIFEGDIVTYLDATNSENGYNDFQNSGVVEWNNGIAGFNITERNSVDNEDVFESSDCVVVGNVIDNPELLEEK